MSVTKKGKITFASILQDEYDFNNFLSSSVGNRRPDINFAKNGSLSKIIYPTKGYTTFDYKGNTVQVNEKVYPPFHYGNIEITTTSEDPMLNSKSIEINNM